MRPAEHLQGIDDDITILQVWKLSFGEVKRFIQKHTARKKWNPDVSFVLLKLKPMVFVPPHDATPGGKVIVYPVQFFNS